MEQRTTTRVAARMPAFLRGGVGVATVLAGVLVVILLVVIVARALTPPPAPNAAEVTAKQFYTAIQHQDYPKAWGMLASQQQAQLTQFAFIRFAQGQDQKYGNVTAFHELRYDADRNQAHQGVVQMQVTRANGLKYAVGLTITLTADGTWKILEEDHAI
ncbi:MAG: hypothetical protein H0X24_15870 [Ktedonobacterales bacterium]|nr:hypothetical protein [Ktedonobacterales bacterium]